jgi:hypothetical protein
MDKITAYDFPDTINVVDGYDSKEVIDLTRKNFAFAVKKINELVDVINELRGDK